MDFTDLTNIDPILYARACKGFDCEHCCFAVYDHGECVSCCGDCNDGENIYVENKLHEDILTDDPEFEAWLAWHDAFAEIKF